MEERKQREGQRSRMGVLPDKGLSCEAAKIMRIAFRALMRDFSKGGPYRFSDTMLDVLQKELQTGQSIINEGQESHVLVGFEFARNGALDVNLLAPICGTADLDNGSLSPAAAPFMPINMAGAASGTTHIKMASIAAELDLGQGILKTVNLMSAILPWEGTATTVLEQCHTIKVRSCKPVYLAVGMVCYTERSGVMFALRNGKFNPLTVVTVAGQQTSTP